MPHLSNNLGFIRVHRGKHTEHSFSFFISLSRSACPSWKNRIPCCHEFANSALKASSVSQKGHHPLTKTVSEVGIKGGHKGKGGVSSKRALGKVTVSPFLTLDLPE